MMDLQTLKRHTEILEMVDWELIPQRALEMFSLKSRGLGARSMVRRSDERHYYFCVDNWEERPRLLLKQRSIHESKTIADIEAPPLFLRACVREHGGGKGVYPLTLELKGWLRKELGL